MTVRKTRKTERGATNGNNGARIRRTERKKIPPIVIIIFLVMTAAFVFNTVKFQMQKAKLEKEKAELVAAIEEQAELKQIYLEELSRVGTKEYYEYLARKHLGYIYPDEKVLINVEP